MVKSLTAEQIQAVYDKYFSRENVTGDEWFERHIISDGVDAFLDALLRELSDESEGI